MRVVNDYAHAHCIVFNNYSNFLVGCHKFAVHALLLVNGKFVHALICIAYL